MAILRFFVVLRTCIQYRLQELLPLEDYPVFARWVLRYGLCWIPAKTPTGTNRGERLRKAFESLGPVFVKFGQLLSTRPDMIPADIAQELCLLQDKVPPFDTAILVNLVEKALDQPLSEVFLNFDRTPLASASVAQVHAAQLKSGQDVIVKVIRPDIASTIEKDVSLMAVIARIAEKTLADGKRLRASEVVDDYRTVILDELDLLREAGNASQLRRNFMHSDILYVPEVHWQYCRSNVMVMERIYGIPVSRIDELRQQNTNIKLLAERGVEIFFTQVFKHNFFHADMHPGNIFVSRKEPANPSYIAVDIAIVGSLSRDDQHYLARNLLAIFNRDYRQVAELHIECGWVPPDTRVYDFEAAIRSVCEPVFEKPLGEISYSQILVNLFRTARRFDMEVQPSLVLLQKTLLNIEGLGRQLYPQLDLWNTAKPFLENWLKERVHPRTLWQDVRRHGPEWLEKFPQLPDMLFDAVQKISRQDMPFTPRPSTPTESLQRSTRPYAFVERLAGIMLLVGAAVLTPEAWRQTVLGWPWPSLLLGGAGLWCLLRRN